MDIYKMCICCKYVYININIIIPVQRNMMSWIRFVERSTADSVVILNC